MLKKIQAANEKLTENVMDFTGQEGIMGEIDFGEKATKDALITKDGKFIRFEPGDNILATKSAPAATAAGAIATAGKAAPADNKPQVIQVNLYLDSKKISEQQVKVSRY